MTVKNHVRETSMQQLDLAEAAMNPRRVDKMSDVEEAIVKWEAAVQRYHDSLPLGAGPEYRINKRRQVKLLMRTLSADLQDKALMDKSSDSYDSVEHPEDSVLQRVRDPAPSCLRSRHRS